MALLFTAQGMYVIREGRMPFTRKKSDQPKILLPYPQRFAIGALYLVVGVGLLYMLLSTGHPRLRWPSIHELPSILLILALLGGAITGIVRPVVIVRWAKSAHPQLAEDDRFALLLTRLIGVFGLCITIFALVIIIRSLLTALN